MSLPGEWTEVDTNHWENPVTGDELKISKQRQVPNKPSSRKWRALVNGDKLHPKSGFMGRNTKKDGAVRKAKSIMGDLTVDEHKEKLKRKRKLLDALESALDTYDSRSEKSQDMDQNRFNKISYNLNDPDEVERWSKDPGSGDLDVIDSPIGSDQNARKMIERRIESVEKSIKETEKKINSA